MQLIKKIFSGKNIKLIYYINNFISYSIPFHLYQKRLNKHIRLINQNTNSDFQKRLNYYNKLSNNFTLEKDYKILKNHIYSKRDYASSYFFDSYIVMRYFNRNYKWNYMFGDITVIPKEPSIVKSRPICENNENSVLLKLDKNRHFVFLNDTISFEHKVDKVIFRGKINDKKSRLLFMKKHFNNPLVDAGDIKDYKNNPKEWTKDRKTLHDHLHYKFIMALEGNDVASNLKWVMSSNSIAIMPKPKFETWFMEGTLIPNYHYILVKDDFSDLDDKIYYYSTHIKEAKNIISHAHEYIKQFKNKKNEKLLSIAVLNKYFQLQNK